MIYNIVMDSGKEYRLEYEGTLEDMVKELTPKESAGIYFRTIATGITINIQRISSIEEL